MVPFIMLNFTLITLRLIGAQTMVQMNSVDVNLCWVKIYQQGNPTTWEDSTISNCSISSCQWLPSSGNDYMNFDDLSSYEDRGYGFYMEWDETYYMTWKQKWNPLEVPIDSTENLLAGEYYTYGLSSSIYRYVSLLDFGGLGLSSDVGVLVDGRSNFGPWYAVGVTLSVAHTGPYSIGIAGWRNRAGNYYLANTTRLYVWDTGCGSWTIPSISPTIRPTVVPTLNPSQPPTLEPSETPTSNPTPLPTETPTQIPSTPVPSPCSSCKATMQPTSTPMIHPTGSPTTHPTQAPSLRPTTYNTKQPAMKPTSSPTISNGGVDFVPSNSDHKILYMFVGFSVSSFVLLAAALFLCSRRIERTRGEKVKQTILELHRLGTFSNSSLRDSVMYPGLDDKGSLNLRQKKLSISRISNTGLAGDSTFSQYQETGSVDVSLVNFLGEGHTPGEPSYQLKIADQAPFEEKIISQPGRTSSSTRVAKTAHSRMEDAIREKVMANEKSWINQKKPNMNENSPVRVRRQSLIQFEEKLSDNSTNYKPRVRSISTRENEKKNRGIFVPGSEEKVPQAGVVDNDYILAELSNWRRELSRSNLSEKSEGEQTRRIETRSSTPSYSVELCNETKMQST